MKQASLVSFLLRVGIATAFLYAAVASIMNPNAWVGYFPAFLREILAERLLLVGFSIFELILALWLLSGTRQKIAALAASITLLAIIVQNLTLLDVIFRDIALLFAALALAALHWK